jgi:hypothetical protein
MTYMPPLRTLETVIGDFDLPMNDFTKVFCANCIAETIQACVVDCHDCDESVCEECEILCPVCEWNICTACIQKHKDCWERHPDAHKTSSGWEFYERSFTLKYLRGYRFYENADGAIVKIETT